MAPPKKGGRAKTGPPLQGCIIAISGKFPGRTQGVIEKDLISPLGGTLAKTVSADTTHLVTTESEVAKPTTKVTQARSHNAHIVNMAWLEDCLDQGVKLDESGYTFGGSNPPSPPAAVPAPPKVQTNGKGKAKATATKKRAAPVVDDDDDEEEEEDKPQPKKVTKPAGAVDSNRDASQAAEGKTNVATLSNLKIPVDESCPLTHYQVYIDDDKVIYDASLNQTNSGLNNNKFYRVQLLHNNGHYKTWTRWGRVGVQGQSVQLGDGSLADALRQFESKFKSKSGLSWVDRAGKAKSGKYTFIERSYTEDSDEEDTEPKVKAESEEKEEAPESKLPLAVQDLMELIFNQQYFAATMVDLNYDTDKMPLGKLAKSTIVKGYQALKDLSDLMNNQSLAQSEHGTNYQAAVEMLSNSYYSTIPHAFGMNRPPLINNQDMLNREVELLDSLSDMKDTANLMKKEPKDAEKINALDRQFRGLGLNEMTPLKRESTEFTELKNYLVETKGATHNANYHVDQIFRIERQGEKDRFDASPFAGPPRDRRLLWHGSRTTNFGGILSQGLRIAPPEAPVSGYMFGKGIYLADMSSKSANYCCSHISNGHVLLLLCEAELGDPKQELTGACYTAGDDAKSNGMYSTWGKGMTGPKVWKDAEVIHPSLKGVQIPDVKSPPGHTGVPDAYLMYNEYIAYDVSQVRLRYLLRVRM
ncbi:poly-ribose polymerase-like protein [Rhexocercosporidium sp. MPI-PUGE-AT-0058]|nr:poly-ribose polymerase-like protein [Rhexocercosporidium sp. MPI-PUGE-AT-0058]